MVIEALSDDMDKIHAVNLKTRVPSPSNILNISLGIHHEQIRQEIA
jgi:hypothetical protein